ncbi:M55 family metallopeptidase [Streptantibioticus ferralitis]|uniref:M55 family metallopeptidase n=1 Tax=Streptantibioticus ferralitis TaxID=236510 RepID=A0ABT5YXE5_9ACTN|nr:M55 family metallopeptidase [Streptantibioticus ferralitis]MDF2256158.1 M55 family metallopeptidase [Streptantibioticus ferralitis]
MKIFVSSDMEGTAGIVDWNQCRPLEAEYGYHRGLLQEEVNAAIEGAMAAGASAFLVNDSHSKMANLRPDALAGRARYLSGRHKPLYMMQGLDASFDGVFFVSYHGSMSGESSVLSHTYNPQAISEVRLNGTPAGEAGINALVALGHGVPVALITGDDITAAEIQPFCPGIRSAVVKTSVSRFAADSLHPEAARELIRAAAEDATRGLAELSAPGIALPATLTVRFRNADLAEMATWITGVLRVDNLTVRITDDDPIRLYRTFVTVVLLTRGIAE